MSFPEAQELLLEATCTDAGNVPSLRVFLNGEELATTGIGAVTDQGNELRYYDLHAFTSLLREGANDLVLKPIEERLLVTKALFQLRLSRLPEQKAFDG